MFSVFPLIRGGIPGLMMLASIFWLWTLIDCVTKESSEGNDKLTWTILIIFLPWLGAILYYFVRRPERVKVVGH
jgi:Phospholipase_D-nuclease N-terminal